MTRLAFFRWPHISFAIPLSRILGVAGLIVGTWASPAHAVLDVEDRGPVLRAGRFAMRITNAGVIGNPYFSVGRSFDPSFEFPRGSGQELLNYAELWVGAIDASGETRVS